MSVIARIPWTEFQFEVSRSGGPGGQNVNKTNSAVQLRWSLELSVAFSFEEKERLREKIGTKLTTNGEVLIRSQTSRDQDQNRKECLRKLDELLTRGLHRPRTRKATKPTRSSQRKRVEHKRQRSEVKSGRRRIQHDD